MTAAAVWRSVKDSQKNDDANSSFIMIETTSSDDINTSNSIYNTIKALTVIIVILVMAV